MAAIFGEDPGTGVRLLAAVERLARQFGMNFGSTEGEPTVKVYKQALAKAEALLGPEAFRAAWVDGQQLTMEQALALATENKD